MSKPRIQFVAVDDPNLARDVGAQPETKPYPFTFTHKSPMRVHLQLQDYSVSDRGTCTWPPARALPQSSTRMPSSFPLTDATVGREHGCGERLFTLPPVPPGIVLVNKGQIVSLCKESSAA